MQNNSVLIAGGSGLIGNQLINLLLAQGYAVNILSRSNKKIKGCAVFNWDVDTGKIDANAFSGVHTIINLAGTGIADKPWTTKRKQEIINSRVQSAQLLYKTLATIKHNVTTYISASAIGIYANTNQWLTENTVPATTFLASVCTQWEDAAQKFNQLNIRTCIFRFGLVLSPHGGMLKEMLLPVKLGVAPVFGNGSQWQSWVHIQDVCNMMLFAIQNQNMKGVFNTVAPNPVTNKQFMQTLQSIYKSSIRIPVPAFVLKLFLGQRAAIVLSNQKVSAQKIIETGFTFSFPELNMALHNLLSEKK